MIYSCRESSLQVRAGCFLPQPLAAGGGDVVMLAAGVDGCLDFSLAALWGRKRGDFGVTV